MLLRSRSFGFVEVALRKESVDRNWIPPWHSWTNRTSLSARRAWIEIHDPIRFSHLQKSLSARRAWIEMMIGIDKIPYQRVALRKESVDRNITALAVRLMYNWSLSARRAWIEISVTRYSPTPKLGRSPQGERG